MTVRFPREVKAIGQLMHYSGQGCGVSTAACPVSKAAGVPKCNPENIGPCRPYIFISLLGNSEVILKGSLTVAPCFLQERTTKGRHIARVSKVGFQIDYY